MDVKIQLKTDITQRNSQIELLVDLLSVDILPPSIFIFGHTSTGKSLVLQNVLDSLDHIQFANVHCIECVSARLLYESVLTQLGIEEHCDNPNDFVHHLRIYHEKSSICIVLDKAERLRDLNDGALYQSLLKIQEFSRMNICLILVSELPYEKFRFGTGSLEPIMVFFPQYTKEEIQELLAKERPVDADPFLYQTYLSMILGVFLCACRDLCELRYIASQHWSSFMEPIERGEIEKTQTVKLWRHLEPKLRQALSQVYLRGPDSSTLHLKTELPFFSKFLIIAGYLASYNPAKYDRRLFVKQKEAKRKIKKLKHLKNQKVLDAPRLAGPKTFPIDRLMAIFYSIVEERVTPSVNLFSQLSTLVSLKLLTHVGSSALFQGLPKYRCNASYDLVKSLARTVNFELGRYLYDSA